MTFAQDLGEALREIGFAILSGHGVDPALYDQAEQKVAVSFPMAVYVWEDEMLEVLPCLPDPKYSPVKAIEFHTSITSKFYGDDYAVKA